MAIQPVGSTYVAPVVYDLRGVSTDIGSAEDNDIVLKGPGVEPYHLALRQMSEQLVLMVDWSLARREGITWRERRDDDRLFCDKHGTLPPNLGRCPRCSKKDAVCWLIRPLHGGDVFPIGQGFEGTVMSQTRGIDAPMEDITAPNPRWPNPLLLEQAAGRELDEGAGISERPYPFDDSNLWVWSPAESPLLVFMHQRANHFVTRHAYQNADREIGGVLLGDVYSNPEDGVVFPVITHAVPARFATEARGHLTFTHDTWRDLNRYREAYHPEKRVVGWYHTHPGLDIFLSQMDLFIHRNFFREAWQVALVIDPHQDLGGFFVWADGDLLDPQQPHQLFRIAEMDDDFAEGHRSRIRIKLGERIE